MKTKLPLILMALLITGCQPKSEVDKCVEAILDSKCIDTNSGATKRCKENLNSYLGAEYRMKCMRAQAGKE